MREASPAQLVESGYTGSQQLCIDVREPWEIQRCSLPDFLVIPMREIPSRLAALDPNKQILVLCHHGVRSRVVCQFLEQNGYTDVVNISGGIDRWAKEVDSSLATY